MSDSHKPGEADALPRRSIDAAAYERRSREGPMLHLRGARRQPRLFPRPGVGDDLPSPPSPNTTSCSATPWSHPTTSRYYGDRQIAVSVMRGGGGDVGFLEAAADERGLALAATEDERVSETSSSWVEGRTLGPRGTERRAR